MQSAWLQEVRLVSVRLLFNIIEMQNRNRFGFRLSLLTVLFFRVGKVSIESTEQACLRSGGEIRTRPRRSVGTTRSEGKAQSACLHVIVKNKEVNYGHRVFEEHIFKGD